MWGAGEFVNCIDQMYVYCNFEKVIENTCNIKLQKTENPNVGWFYGDLETYVSSLVKAD